jgi:hypothetical protein
MKRKYPVFAVIFVISLLIGIQAVEVVDANPIARDSLPNQEEFKVTIKTPYNNTSFKDSNIQLNFTVSFTEYWKAYPIGYYYASLSSVDVYLDRNLSVHYKNHPNNYSYWINQTSTGQHILNVTANFVIQYMGLGSSSYPKAISKIVYFTVEQQEPNPSTMPTSATDLLSNSMLILAIAAVIVIVAVAVVSLVYFKRRGSHEDKLISVCRCVFGLKLIVFSYVD